MQDNDTAFASDSTEVDPTYDTGLFGSDLSGYTEGERQVGSKPIPKFENYFLKVVGGEGQESDKGPSYARLQIKVVKGPEGTVDRQFFSNVFFHVNPVKTNRRDGSQTVRSKDELAKAKKNLGDGLLKIARVLGLSKATPDNGTKDAITAWCGQAVEAGAIFIGEVRIEAAKGDYPARNSLAWQSIAALGDPVKDEKTKQVIPGKTAGKEAEEKIAAFAAREAKGSGTTAQSHGPARPTGFRA